MTQASLSHRTGEQLVLGAAVGYSAEQLTPFLGSLRVSGYKGDIALVVDRESVETLRQSRMLEGVALIPVRYWGSCRAPITHKKNLRSLAWLPLHFSGWLALRMASMGLLGRARAASSVIEWAQSCSHPIMSRHFHYREYLREHPYRRVLLSDVRDVLFQTNPFDHLPHDGLAVSLESGYTLAEEYWNSGWVRITYGASTLRAIGHNPVSCAGVTYGDGASICRYLDLLLSELYALSFRANLTAGDQGVHNVLLWTGRLGAFTPLPTFDSPVATLNEVGAEKLRFDAQGRLLNHDGTPVSIIHQYDRHANLASRLLESISARARARASASASAVQG